MLISGLKTKLQSGLKDQLGSIFGTSISNIDITLSGNAPDLLVDYALAGSGSLAVELSEPSPYQAVGSSDIETTLTGSGAFESVGYTIDTLTPAQIATITGKPEPTLMWLGGDAAGADELVVGTDDLSDVASPSKQVNSATLGGLVTEFTGTTQSMDAAGSGVADVGAETFTWVYIGAPDAPVSTYQLFGKRGGPSLFGYEVRMYANGRIDQIVDSASGVRSNLITSDHGSGNAHVLLGTRESTANNQAVYSREGSASSARYNETLSNPDVLSICQGRLSGVLGEFGAFMVWIGTDGDGFGESDRLAIAEALGYE